jgi:nitroimidazol reductase NimA-like FMN-containing flavoprotein (pyridoxamine 5'-phosphate oxidase superfamily)
VARERILMGADELRDFLAAQDWMVLATLDPDGSPAGDVVPTVLAEDRLYFAVATEGLSHRNLTRDPRACCAADVFPSYYEIRGAMVHGQAGTATPPPGAHAVGRAAASGAAVFALPLDDVTSFDFAKIRTKY